VLQGGVFIGLVAFAVVMVEVDVEFIDNADWDIYVLDCSNEWDMLDVDAITDHSHSTPSAMLGLRQHRGTVCFVNVNNFLCFMIG
jgi:hypothetical protein